MDSTEYDFLTLLGKFRHLSDIFPRQNIPRIVGIDDEQNPVLDVDWIRQKRRILNTTKVQLESKTFLTHQEALRLETIPEAKKDLEAEREEILQEWKIIQTLIEKLAHHPYIKTDPKDNVDFLVNQLK